jgi:hypothetical protein
MESDTRAKIDASWGQFLETVNGIPEERLTEAGAVGDWSVKDLLGHVAYWDNRAAERAEGVPADDSVGWQVLNDRAAAERAGWTLAQAQAELERSHAHMLAALEAHPELPADHWADATWEHYDEHVADLSRWLNGA